MADLALGQTIRIQDDRVGIVRFIGQTHFAGGDWVGVELEDSSGKNDGSVQGERYFDCDMGRGMFVRPSACTILTQPEPGPAARANVAASPAGVAARGKPVRPNSLFTGPPGTGRVPSGVGDLAVGRRRSLNAPSPSPAQRASRPSSTVRSVTKSPSKQMGTGPPSIGTGPPSIGTGPPSIGTGPSSAVPSRTATPSNTRPPNFAPRSRPPGTPGARTSMGPPPVPMTKVRQTSASSVAGPARTGSAAAAARPIGPRLASFNTGRAPPTLRPTARPADRNPSVGSTGSSETGGLQKRSLGSPLKTTPVDEDPDNYDAALPSPVQIKTQALEKLTGARVPPIRSPISSSASRQPSVGAGGASVAAANKEIEDLKAKLKVLEKKRIDDRESLRRLDKLQADRDKFERVIQTIQMRFQPLQQENQELKRLLHEAEQRLNSVEGMQAEYDSAMELATLDREMAEEQAEVLKSELEALKQKSEETELEVEVLREENAEYSRGVTAEERSTTGWMALERDNVRLRDALIRFRDICEKQEDESKDKIKGLEEDLVEFEAVRERYGDAQEKIAQAESAINDLKEQLDVAEANNDIIEQLTDERLAQSEKIDELKAIIDDLENLKEINDELEINHVQNEKEMQEEIDFKEAIVAEQARRMSQQEEMLEDMEYTLSRFRELVTSLQSDLEDMRASHAVTETEAEQLTSRSRAMLDLNMKLQISAAKAQVKTIDLELRRLEAQEAEQHLEMVKLFLPETYKQELRDPVLALLRFRRLAFKATLLAGFLKERMANPPHPGHEDDVFWACEAVDKLAWVSTMCDRFVNAISHCSLDRFTRFEGALYELEPVERALNGWIDGLRNDELKEKQCSTDLQRTIALMSHLSEVHIPSARPIDAAEGEKDGEQQVAELESFADAIHMRVVLTQSHLDSAAVSFATLRTMVQRVVPATSTDDEGNETEDDLAQYFAKRAEAAVTQTRSTKVIAAKTVRALEDLQSRSLTLQPESTAPAFEQCEALARELAEMARRFGTDLHGLLHEEGRTRPYTYAEAQDRVQRTAQEAFSASESEPFASYLTKLRVLNSQLADLVGLTSDLAQTHEFERPTEPWVVRSRELAARHTVPLDAEEEMRRLRDDGAQARRLVAERDEGLSTMQLKIDTLEARMRDAGAKTARIAELETQLTGAGEEGTRMREEMTRQDRELKQLEADRDKWKKVARDVRLGNIASGSGGGGGAGGIGREGEAMDPEITAFYLETPAGGAAGGIGGQALTPQQQQMQKERMVATRREMDALHAEIRALQSAVRFLREDSRRARTVEQARYEWLAEPLAGSHAKKQQQQQQQRQQQQQQQAEGGRLPGVQRVAAMHLVAAEARDVAGELLRMATSLPATRVFELGRMARKGGGGGEGDSRQQLPGLTSWRPARETPQYHAARQMEDLAAWKGWEEAVRRKAKALLGQEEQQQQQQLDPMSHAEKARRAKSAAARMQIRLPGVHGKGTGRGILGGGQRLHIVGSREWEGLQGRLGLV